MAILDDRRDDWDARPPRSDLSYISPLVRSEFFVHWDGDHPVGLFGRDHDACLAKVRQDQGFHQGPERGWSDIGYNALICPHARVIEGRGLDYIGAHCPNHNALGYGVQMMIGEGEQATAQMMRRAIELRDDLVARSGPLRLYGHADGFGTACPGPQLLSWVHAGMPAPLAIPNPIPSEEDTVALISVRNPVTGKPAGVGEALSSMWRTILLGYQLQRQIGINLTAKVTGADLVNEADIAKVVAASLAPTVRQAVVDGIAASSGKSAEEIADAVVAAFGDALESTPTTVKES